ncbi:protein adenylyltransferase SelO [Methylobacterium oryzisoli]|uniref:protein adenylyltransferase SelO n=1 Tax=Methylobacterium oryzisoli TaxID=3385502 RepID=UPI003892C512
MSAIPFDNSYARLPGRFFARVDPTPVPAPQLISLNRALAEALQIDPDWLASPDGVPVLAGNAVPPGAEPIATAYAGHQFGHLVPQLGDGRAILLGEVVDRGGTRRDIQLKGAGPTPFSRRGDGRAALGPVLREYLVSEAMAALGIPTTRALAAVTTGANVARERLLPGAILTRVAASHIRVGTFQFFAIRRDTDGVKQLADHVIARHYPAAAESRQPYQALLAAVIERQAALVAQWLCVGFIHGVMNTDNMAVTGETIDYGPCAFLDAYDPATVFSAIDEHGRYAYGNQPAIAQWNLARLAEALLPLLAPETESAIAVAQDLLAGFVPRFETAYHAGLRRKLGLFMDRESDVALAGGLLEVMTANRADFTLTFRRLGAAAADPAADRDVRDLFIDPTAYDAWAARWRERLAAEPRPGAERRETMDAANPAFIPRNHRVEAVIAAAIERDDFGPFAELNTVLAKPYDDQAAFAAYADPPAEYERVQRTFCGT